MTKKQKTRAARCNKGWAMKNCVYKKPMAETFSDKRQRAIQLTRIFYHGGICKACKIVKVELREIN